MSKQKNLWLLCCLSGREVRSHRLCAAVSAIASLLASPISLLNGELMASYRSYMAFLPNSLFLYVFQYHLLSFCGVRLLHRYNLPNDAFNMSFYIKQWQAVNLVLSFSILDRRESLDSLLSCEKATSLHTNFTLPICALLSQYANQFQFQAAHAGGQVEMQGMLSGVGDESCNRGFLPRVSKPVQIYFRLLRCTRTSYRPLGRSRG